MSNRFTKACGAVATAALLLTGMAMASSDDMKTMDGMHHAAPAKAFAFGEPGASAEIDRTMTVAITEMSFEPNSIAVRTGETIRFLVSNASEIDHDFTIGDLATQAAHRKEMIAAMESSGEMAHGDDPNAISVKAGQSGELIWKFTRAGSFEFDCNVPGHYEAGMSGTIAVRGEDGGHAEGAP